MCLAVFEVKGMHGNSTVVYETRDQSIHAAHGTPAARALGVDCAGPYGFHWRENPGLLDRLWTLRAGHDRLLAELPIRGGLDAGGGTWLAVNERSGVYARILIAPAGDGTLGESPSAALRTRRERSGYVSRSGVCIDAAMFDDAESAAQALRSLPARLAATGNRMLPFYVLVADARGAFVVHHADAPEVTVQAASPDEVHVLSVRGLDVPEAAMTDLLRGRLAGSPAPDADPASWDPWLRAFGAEGHMTEAQYADPAWRAHRTTAVQPPYLNTQDASRHRRAPWPGTAEPGEVEWTKSSTCAVIDGNGLRLLMYDERHVDAGTSWPTTLEGARFPRTAGDYAIACAGSLPTA